MRQRLATMAPTPAKLSVEVMLRRIEIEESRRACEESLHEFVKQAWHIVEPGTPFVDGEHIREICRHLEAITRGDIRFLLINIPPRHSKSTIVSVMWPCWEWTQKPTEKYLCASYSGLLSTRDNLKSRRLMTHPWYADRWGKVFTFANDQNQKTRFENDKTGYRIATSVGGTSTGEGGSRLILDDPHSAQNAQSKAMREADLEWFEQTWSTRMNDPAKDASVVIMQRLHEKDVSGRILELGGYEHLCFPCEYDKVKRKTVLGPYDSRTKAKQLLWPERFGPDEIKRLKATLGEYGSAGQLQQIPAPPGGGILKPGFFRLWPNDRPLPPFTYILQSYDTAFEKDEQNDPTALVALAVFYYEKEYHAMIIDAWDEHLSFPQLRSRAMVQWGAKYGGNKTDPANSPRKPDIVLIENKASGISMLQELASLKVTVAKSDPGKLDKVARAHIVAPLLNAGYVWVPESKHDGEWPSWAYKLKEQLRLFPNAEHDDYVDALTQALRYLRDRGFVTIKGQEDDSNPVPRKPVVGAYYA